MLCFWPSAVSSLRWNLSIYVKNVKAVHSIGTVRCPIHMPWAPRPHTLLASTHDLHRRVLCRPQHGADLECWPPEQPLVSDVCELEVTHLSLLVPLMAQFWSMFPRIHQKPSPGHPQKQPSQEHPCIGFLLLLFCTPSAWTMLSRIISQIAYLCLNPITERGLRAPNLRQVPTKKQLDTDKGQQTPGTSHSQV